MNIKEYVEKYKPNVSEMARCIGVKPGHLWSIVSRGRRPSVDVARQLIEVTDGKCTLDELLPNQKPLCEKCGRPLPKKNGFLCAK